MDAAFEQKYLNQFEYQINLLISVVVDLIFFLFFESKILTSCNRFVGLQNWGGVSAEWVHVNLYYNI